MAEPIEPVPRRTKTRTDNLHAGRRSFGSANDPIVSGKPATDDPVLKRTFRESVAGIYAMRPTVILVASKGPVEGTPATKPCHNRIAANCRENG
jgi:hypothetical protein